MTLEDDEETEREETMEDGHRRLPTRKLDGVNDDAKKWSLEVRESANSDVTAVCLPSLLYILMFADLEWELFRRILAKGACC